MFLPQAGLGRQFSYLYLPVAGTIDACHHTSLLWALLGLAYNHDPATLCLLSNGDDRSESPYFLLKIGAVVSFHRHFGNDM